MPKLAQPFANYFGPQRFGNDNLVAAKRWLVDRQPRRVNKARRAIFIGSPQSYIQSDFGSARISGLPVYPGSRRFAGAIGGIAVGARPFAFY